MIATALLLYNAVFKILPHIKTGGNSRKIFFRSAEFSSDLIGSEVQTQKDSS